MLLAVGVNHRTVATSVLERLVFDPNATTRMLARLSELRSVSECVLLSTCSRTELYVVTKEPTATDLHANTTATNQHANTTATSQPTPKLHPASYELLACLASESELDLDNLYACAYDHTELAAVRHLFEVTSGLDSIVVGENQILGQVRSAFQLAQSQRFTGTHLNHLFTWAIRVGKKTRTQTHINEGATSICQAAVQLASNICPNLNEARILLLGTGRMGTLILKHLAAHLPHPAATHTTTATTHTTTATPATTEITAAPRLTVASRSYEHALQTAAPLPFATQAVKLSQALEHLGEYDVVFAATATPTFLVTPTRLPAPGDQQRRLLIDIGLPRNIDPACAGPHTTLLNLDNLSQAIATNLHSRAAQIPNVRQLVEHEVHACHADLLARNASPVVTALRTHHEHILEETIHRPLFRHASDDERDLLRSFGQALLSRLLHAPSAALRELSGTGIDSQTQWETLQTYGWLPHDLDLVDVDSQHVPPSKADSPL